MNTNNNFDWNEDINLKALFIGSKSENIRIFKRLMKKMIDEHAGWRLNYMPQDPSFISEEEKKSSSFKDTIIRVTSVLDQLSLNLRKDSLPWHSAGRFLGHMNSETLMPAILAYAFASLWNGNNVAYESSPGTSKMEEEVGHDFAHLMGFKNGWGHISADGSLANAEGLWYMRNLKSIPLAIQKVAPEKVGKKTEWELLNMPTSEILDLLSKLPDNVVTEVKNHSARAGMDFTKLGKLIVPRTKHYSWLKAADILGIGLEQVVECDVDDEYHMDTKKLEEIINNLAAKKIPILGVIGVVGTTEEGQIDRIHEIVKLREAFAKKGIYFYIHVDAAFGGYARSIFLDEENNFIPFDKLREHFQSGKIFQSDGNSWLTKEIYDSFKAISEAESVTIDPHKMGYVPYSAGGIAIRDIRMRELISYFATYVFEKGANIPALLGAYILEGSKAGATAAAVWTVHRILPLNINGFGKLIAASVESSVKYYKFLQNKTFTMKDGKIIDLFPVVRPDFNIVDYVFKERGNDDLVQMNQLNHEFYNYASYVKGGSIYSNPLIVSHTDFDYENYSDAPLSFVKKLGFSEKEWRRAGKITVIRSVVMSPYLRETEVSKYFFEEIEQAMQSKLEAVYAEQKK